ncbi:hypothetical protein [Dehalobacter sp. TBBPA1]|uniref:hypothetical protein n=1 Tax=Dehalobacter sp. TBBPA1 TaxID=3235037 RepID=UPI0034A3C4BF
MQIKTLLKTACAVVVALLIQYLYLEGPAIASFQNDRTYEYQVDNYAVKAQFPATTEVHLTPDKGEEMRLNIYFTDSKLSFRGYLQIWRAADLEHFLQDSKARSTYNFISYVLKRTSLNHWNGFEESWSADFGENVISSQEYWLELNDNNEVVRISFFTDQAFFPDSTSSIIRLTLDSISVENH